MLTFQSLVQALKDRGISRKEGARATGWGEDEAALEKYVRLNSHFPPEEAARQLAQCLGEIGEPLFNKIYGRNQRGNSGTP